MKILKISFQNLNSLKGKHSIDLENGPLGEAGIFAITGPTGAGKSTLLDAITLALFGKAARYETEANPGEMMTRGTGECSAEVLFECSQGRYTAKWNRARAHRNPEGKLQNPKREIAKAPSGEADSGEILAEKVREADTLIESLTGLDYHRFLRSVLLAQGRSKNSSTRTTTSAAIYWKRSPAPKSTPKSAKRHSTSSVSTPKKSKRPH
jgi:exonuclease SbcC